MNTTSTTPKPLFPNFTQIPSSIPIKVWNILRIISVVSAITVCIILFTIPQIGLFILWKIIIPLLPLVFFIVPGLWRNLCPLAALNQAPRLWGITRGLTHTNTIKEYSYVIGISLFFLLVFFRKVFFDDSGLGSALLILGALSLAFLGGVFFKGKSGWCSSICPLLPVQRLYGQTPFVTVPNSHCQPCVGCTKNCYDFNPSVAYLADQYDDDKYYTGYRRFFAGTFPGFVLAFYLVDVPPDTSISMMVLEFYIYVSISLGTFFLLDTFTKATNNKLTALYGAAAFNIFYWFNLPTLISSFNTISGISLPEWFIWILRSLIFGLTLFWVIRTVQTERKFITRATTSSITSGIKLGAGAAAALERFSKKQQLEKINSANQ